MYCKADGAIGHCAAIDVVRSMARSVAVKEGLGGTASCRAVASLFVVTKYSSERNLPSSGRQCLCGSRIAEGAR